MTAPLLYCVHGWGFDREFWSPLLACLPGVAHLCADQGYFSEPALPPLPDVPYLAVGHSAGVLSLLAQDLPGCVGVMSFNGFARFSAAPDVVQGVAPRVLLRMQARLQNDPIAVLQDFRHLCGTDAPVPPTAQTDRLAAGLDALIRQDHRARAARWGRSLHWASGEDDPLPVAKSGFPPPSVGHVVRGGHLLPLEQPEYCATLIKRMIHAFF